MHFGKITTQHFSKDGDYIEIAENIADGVVTPPIIRTTETRAKVHNIEEEIEEYRKFSEMVRSTPNILRPVFKIDFAKHNRDADYYYVVKCYTELVPIEKV